MKGKVLDCFYDSVSATVTLSCFAEDCHVTANCLQNDSTGSKLTQAEDLLKKQFVLLNRILKVHSCKEESSSTAKATFILARRAFRQAGFNRIITTVRKWLTFFENLKTKGSSTEIEILKQYTVFLKCLGDSAEKEARKAILAFKRG